MVEWLPLETVRGVLFRSLEQLLKKPAYTSYRSHTDPLQGRRGELLLLRKRNQESKRSKPFWTSGGYDFVLCRCCAYEDREREKGARAVLFGEGWGGSLGL